MLFTPKTCIARKVSVAHFCVHKSPTATAQNVPALTVQRNHGRGLGLKKIRLGAGEQSFHSSASGADSSGAWKTYAESYTQLRSWLPQSKKPSSALLNNLRLPTHPARSTAKNSRAGLPPGDQPLACQVAFVIRSSETDVTVPQRQAKKGRWLIGSIVPPRTPIMLRSCLADGQMSHQQNCSAVNYT